VIAKFLGESWAMVVLKKEVRNQRSEVGERSVNSE